MAYGMSFSVGGASRFYTAGCGKKMAVSVTGPRAVNELGGPVILAALAARHVAKCEDICHVAKDLWSL